MSISSLPLSRVSFVSTLLVLAATLLEIKTRMLLPSAPPEEGGEAGVQRHGEKYGVYYLAVGQAE